MSEIKNLEVIQLNTIDGKLMATVSYQNTVVNDVNNGYGLVEIPVNIRELKLSVRGNILVNQSLGIEDEPKKGLSDKNKTK